MVSVDFERLFDTLFDSIRTNVERRKILSLRAREGHEKHGRGLFVVNAFSQDGSITNDSSTLFENLEWWNHDKCLSGGLPEYAPEDPMYNPEIFRYLHTHDVNADFIVGMYYEVDNVIRGSTLNTLAHYAVQAVYMKDPNSQCELNPYEESKIGTNVEFVGNQCGALDCDVMKAKRTVAVDCKECGATKESCACLEQEKIDNRQGKKLKDCGGCGQISYCSRECQSKDWKRHKVACKKNRTMTT